MTAGFEELLAAHVAGHEAAVRAMPVCGDVLRRIADAWVACLRSGGKVIFLGNGGSAADAQHLAAELVVRYRRNRGALAGLALTTDTSILTAHGNDFGFETVFARQVEALAGPGDVVVCISTSGNSANVVAALRAANEKGCVTVAFTGADGGECGRMAKLAFRAPSDVTAHAQECHLMAGHVLCQWVEDFFAER
jgi:D-sedoheptulose 7-phosphate isomerase